VSQLLDRVAQPASRGDQRRPWFAVCPTVAASLGRGPPGEQPGRQKKIVLSPRSPEVRAGNARSLARAYLPDPWCAAHHGFPDRGGIPRQKPRPQYGPGRASASVRSSFPRPDPGAQAGPVAETPRRCGTRTAPRWGGDRRSAMGCISRPNRRRSVIAVLTRRSRARAQSRALQHTAGADAPGSGDHTCSNHAGREPSAFRLIAYDLPLPRQKIAGARPTPAVPGGPEGVQASLRNVS